MAFARLKGLVKAPKPPVAAEEAIFSDEEIRKIYQALVPHISSQTFLLQSHKGIRTTSQVLGAIEKAIKSGTSENLPERFTSITTIAKSLDLANEVVENLFPSWKAGDTWGRSGDVIFTQHGYTQVSKELLDQLEKAPLKKRTFCEQQRLSLEILESMIAQYQDSCMDGKNGIPSEYRLEMWERGDYMFTGKFRDSLKETISGRMAAAVEPTRIFPTTKDESMIPQLLVSKIAIELISSGTNTLRGRVWVDGPAIRFTPYDYLLGQRDSFLQEIKNGKRDFLTDSDILAIDIEAQGFREFIASPLGDGGIPFERVAISHKFLEKTVSNTHMALETRGAASLAVFSPDVSIQDLAALSDKVFETLQRSESDLGDVYRTGRLREHYVRKSYHESVKSEVIQLAEAQATSPQTKMIASKVSWPLIVDSVHKTRKGVSETLISSLLSPSIQLSAANAYTLALQSAQEKSQNAFSKFWSTKCLARTRLYLQGIAGLRDARLKKELHRVTLVFLVEKTVPDVIRRAEEADYLHGRAHVRVVDILERQLSALEANLTPPSGSPRAAGEEVDLNGVAEMLEDALSSFSRAVGIEAPGLAIMIEAKRTHLHDTMTSTDKETEPARLFLKLVLVLIACYREGVVHASGRFAPKLMKEMQEKLGEETYDWMRDLRDAARTGTMKPEDMERAKKMIRDAIADWEKGVKTSPVDDGID
ncbi:MAG: hypothetical protein M1814_005997 [Vezdaea aestivalis]|nr:MAG: hypothetical protein M1814_005997 [Vezdaea aestivalis]